MTRAQSAGAADTAFSSAGASVGAFVAASVDASVAASVDASVAAFVGTDGAVPASPPPAVRGTEASGAGTREAPPAPGSVTAVDVDVDASFAVTASAPIGGGD
ncbi:hypothetical protein GCM10010243_36670 [Streptomyces matensis]|nr:hypothetical protein GCM10010243_36670 [Streptomyces matensis]